MLGVRDRDVHLPAMKQPCTTTPQWLTDRVLRSEAFGLMYVRKKSRDMILLTAITEEETVLVIAMNTSTSRPAVAPCPSRERSTYGMTIPELTWVKVSVSGYPTHTGVCSIARALSPMMVPVHQGTARITTETSM